MKHLQGLLQVSLDFFKDYRKEDIQKLHYDFFRNFNRNSVRNSYKDYFQSASAILSEIASGIPSDIPLGRMSLIYSSSNFSKYFQRKFVECLHTKAGGNFYVK